MRAFQVSIAIVLGAMLWTLAEYLLHRFAMHELHGKGIMSREHLEHHVHAGWHFSYTHLLSWTGMLMVGALIWSPLTATIFGATIGYAVAGGWALGYFFYEAQHALSHLRSPRTRYTKWLAKHHFHHHFGRPMSNHGVTLPIWDRVFDTLDEPKSVRVPRRLAPKWLLTTDGDVRSEFAADYALVGSADGAERLAKIDRARAFASLAPVS